MSAEPAATLSALSGGRLFLAGSVDSRNVADVRLQGEKALNQVSSETYRLDLSELVSASSVVVSLLIRWTQYAGRFQVHLKCEGAGERLRALARIGGVSDLIEGLG